MPISHRTRLVTLSALGLGLALPLTDLFRERQVAVASRRPLKLDLNHDPASALVALPGLGPVIVGELVRVRKEAPLTSFRDLDRRVRGIGPARIRAITPHVILKPPPRRVRP